MTSHVSDYWSNGRLILNDSYVNFGNWKIDANIVGPNEPGLSEWSGSFRVQKSDQGKIFNLSTSGQLIKAEFYESNRKHSGNIIIIDPGTIVHFKVTGMLNESS